MQRIVVAAKAGADQPWLADAAAELAQQTGAAVSVVSLDGLDVEALSPTPRSEFRELAEQTINGFLARLGASRGRGRGRRPRRPRDARGPPLRRGEERRPDRVRRLDEGQGRPPRARQRAGRTDPARPPPRPRHQPVLGGAPWRPPAKQQKTGLFATKPIEALVKDTEDKDTQLKRAVGALDLTALGLGAIIGTGIFVIIGEAITTSGPSIILSFILAGVTCVFSALAFAELASAIPVSGSAYTYSYATIGELAAWIIGWDLILEYGVSIAGVAIGWGAYLNELLESVFNYELPKSLANPPGEDGGQFNLPAMFLVLAVSAVLMVGVRESARTNTIMVFFKLAVLALFLVLGVTAFNADNFSPFFVEGEGIGGTVTAATLIFFAYIGFDAVSTSSEEVKEPKRDLPIAIIGSLGIATTLYILVAVVATGALPFDELKGQDAPLATALSEGAGFDWAANIISFGALVAITSVVLTLLYGQSRILFAMSRDGLMPKRVGKVNQRTRTPVFIIGACGVVFSILAAVVPLAEIVKLVNIGTLFAFIVVNLGVIILRRTKPDMERGYRVPFVPVFPIIGIALCVYWRRTSSSRRGCGSSVWMALGLVIYFSTASATRGCARARSSTPRPSFRTPLAFPPAPAGADGRGSVHEEEESYVQVRVVAALMALGLFAPPLAQAADELSTSNRLDDRRFVTIGPRAYELGTEAGRYPAAGFHTRGEMGGVWTPPIKLVDGIWFGVGDDWIGPATRFTSGYGHVKMRLPRTGGLRVERTDFVPGERRGVLVGLKLKGDGKRTVKLRMQTHSELMSIYPWGETTPSQTDASTCPTRSPSPAVARVRRVRHPAGAERAPHTWGAAVGSRLTPSSHRTGDGFRGPQGDVICPASGPDTPTAARRAVRRHRLRQGQGRRADLRDQAPALRPHDRVVRRRRLRVRRRRRARRARASCSTTPRARCARSCASARRSPAARSSTCPATGCSSAASSGASRTSPTPCRRRATSSCARSTRARTTRRRRRTMARARFVGAGFPDYPWLFATDGEFTAFASVALGQFEPIKEHMRALKEASIKLNDSSGKVVHEVVTDGSVYFGANADAGNTDETAKFPSAVALIWRWTGDNAFRDEMYDFAKSNLRYIYRELDVDGDGWPEGLGNVERPGMGEEKLDNTDRDDARPARPRGPREVQGRHRDRDVGGEKAADLESRFENAWWMTRSRSTPTRSTTRATSRSSSATGSASRRWRSRRCATARACPA